jgi:hypothetical protein
MIGRELGNLAHDHPYDALQEARGSVLHFLVEPWPREWGDMRIIRRLDATDLLKEFTRWCALQVADLWDASPNALTYLKTGDRSLEAEVGELAFRIAVSNCARGRAAAATLWTTNHMYCMPAHLAARDGASSASVAKAEIEAQKSPGPYVCPSPEASVVKAQRTKFKELVDNAS